MTNWSQLEKRIKELSKEPVTEVDFDLVIRDGIASAQAIIDIQKQAMYQYIKEYEKKEDLKKDGYRLKYFRQDGIVHAEIDEDYEKIRKQRWDK